MSVGGGAEAALYRLIKADRDNLHTVITLRPISTYRKLLEELGTSVYSLDLPRSSLNARAVIRLWKLCRLLRPDVVQTWMYHADFLGGIVARIAGLRAVVWGVHHTALDRHGSSFSVQIIAAMCVPLSYWVPKKIVCCSLASIAAHKKKGYPSRKMVFCFNGQDPAVLHSRRVNAKTWKQSLQLSDNGLIFGVVARWDDQKDYPTLFRALEAFNQSYASGWQCVIAGREIDQSNRSLIALIKKHRLDDHIVLAGIRRDIPELMQSIDLLILSSRYGEGFPNVLCEAMLWGTPCIATDVGDSSSIVGNTGWIVPPGDSDALASALTKISREIKSDGWEGVSKKCSERIIEHFSIEKMRMCYNAVWSDAMNTSR